MEEKYIVESDIILRAVTKPFPKRQTLGVFLSASNAYDYIEKYIEDTKDLHTYYSRSYLCSKQDLEDHIINGKMVGFNLVLGQFEDMLYITKTD